MDAAEDEDPTTPVLDEEIIAGRAALDEGDALEALMRAARAVAVSPFDPIAVAFADDVIRSVPNPLGPLEGDDVSFGIVALRARVHAFQGRRMEAIDLALQVAAFRPSLCYATWALAWCRGLEPSSDQAKLLVRRLGGLLGALEPPLDEGARDNARAALTIVGLFSHATIRLDQATFLRVGFLRRLNEVDLAIEEARRGWSGQPSWITAVTLGEALRQGGNREDAIRAFAQATTLDVDDASAWVELAELHWETEDIEATIQACVEALARDPELREPRQLMSAARARVSSGAQNERPRSN